MSAEASREYLKSLINKTLHIHTDDRRMFVGMFKCTDNERNIILSQAFEHREPSAAAIRAAPENPTQTGSVKVDMESRFLGLIVVPGSHITKIEAE